MVVYWERALSAEADVNSLRVLVLVPELKQSTPARPC